MSVPITAVGLRTALPGTAADLLAALDEGRTAVAPVQGFDAAPFQHAGRPHTNAAQIWTDADEREDDPALRILGPHGRLLEAVAQDVYDHAGVASLVRERVGLHIATGMVDSAVPDLEPAVRGSLADDGTLDLSRFFSGAYRTLHPLWPLSMLGNVAVGQIATDLDIRGDNLVVSSDAVAGVRALLEGRRAVASGTCDASLSGGVAEKVGPARLMRRFFDRTAQGSPAGEGAGLLVFGGPEPALARLSGGATTFGAPAAVGRAIRKALAEAAVSPGDVDAVFTGMAGERGVDDAESLDRAEHQAISDVLPRDGCKVFNPALAIGDLGPARAAVHAALAANWLASTDGARAALIVVAAAGGGAGALVLEAA